ncbi:hypothetical protein K2173_008865 [Erythroxylum novogranatense]|uniref:Protein N-terminal glutamine amidohydrolase n=1 Tax=Erythroxylum novogranatense TaxID=1862640 RepID=A0AAV8UE05_9ROSI|nr:hypothetical protein K2173_008865 [Erythroxylum novogranatense]
MASSTSFEISQFQHTPFYCEENVYMLCKKLKDIGVADADGSDLFVAFISNDKKQVPLWYQKGSMRADGAVIWDYHVICIQRKRDTSSAPLVWDLDSSLPFPSALATYVAETIRPSFKFFSEYQRFFRIVHAPVFLRWFSSTRSHMKDPTGNWIAEPPAYDPIVAEDGTVHNLNEYLEIHAHDVVGNVGTDMIVSSLTQKFGMVIDVNQVEEFFSKVW